MLSHDLTRLLHLQDGVVSRPQALASGLTVADIRRLVRRREWARVHPGVYVRHTGPLSWQQRAWAAVLACAPAAKAGRSALRAWDGPGRRGHDDTAPIEVVVDARRTVVAPTGVVLRRRRALEDLVAWQLHPPRLRLEEVVLDLADAAADEMAAVAVLADALSSRRTTAHRLRDHLRARPRLARRDHLALLLDDVASGACSVLERAYLRDVELAHGLPIAQRQVRASSRGTVYRDVLYPAWATVVELDGRLDHTLALDRDRDLDRDLDAAAGSLLTVRLGWGQVVGRPCRTAAHVAAVLRSRGWPGPATTCPRCDVHPRRSA